MTIVKVINASALATVLFAEPEADDIARRMHGVSLIAPRLLSFELANICRTKCRKEPHLREPFVEGMKAADGHGIEELPIDRDSVLILALDTGLTAYDASYLWLALNMDAELITLDYELAKVWADRTIIPPPA